MTTEDGYILRLHRIPYGKKSAKKEGEKRPAVLVQHGILSSSADWVLAIPEKALGKDILLGPCDSHVISVGVRVTMLY